jgi:hypothetical protein
MRRAQPLTEGEFAAWGGLRRAVRAWDYRGARDEEYPFKPKASDWGWLDGKPVAAVLLAIGAFAMTGPTAAAPWLPLADSLEGIVEELIFRGAIFRLLWSIFGAWWALGLSSALFGAWHLVKPGADLIAVLGVMFAGGIPMTALYIVTGRLWVSIGYHMPGTSPKHTYSGRGFRAATLAQAYFKSERGRG